MDVRLQALSIELQLAILELMPRSAYKTLRLVSSRLNAIISPLLYERIWPSSHPIDLEVFKLVVRNPLLRRGVKEFIWDDTTFCDPLIDKKSLL